MPSLSHVHWSWLGLAAATLACASLNGGTTVPSTRPDDFSITYNWYEGTVPPPYHYEYMITIESDGAGLVTYSPDYPGADVPTWTEPFTLDSSQMDALYTQLRDLKVFTTAWSEADQVPVGGSHANLTILVDGRTVDIPAFPATVTAEAESAKSAIIAVVPADIWDRLSAQRDQYMQDHLAP